MSKNLIFGEKAKNVTIKLYSWEKIPVKNYIKLLRVEKRKEIGEKNVRGTNTNCKRQELG